MANRLDEQAVLGLAGDEHGAAIAPLEHAGLAVKPQLAAGLIFAMTFQARIDEDGANLLLEERQLVGIVGITVAGENPEHEEQNQQPLFHRGTNSLEADNRRRIRQDVTIHWREGERIASIVIFVKAGQSASAISVSLPGSAGDCK